MTEFAEAVRAFRGRVGFSDPIDCPYCKTPGSARLFRSAPADAGSVCCDTARCVAHSPTRKAVFGAKP